jgi:hypothetical protein
MIGVIRSARRGKMKVIGKSMMREHAGGKYNLNGSRF